MEEPRTARQDLLAFLREERGWVSRGMVCAELAGAMAMTGNWFVLTADEWLLEVERAVRDGVIEVKGTDIRVPLVVEKPKEVLTQGSLF